MKKKIAFVCTHNSCRSQMAEAWAKELGGDFLEVFSAGIEEYPEVKPKAVQVMEEVNISMEGYHPKLISDIPNEFDYLITMGCDVICPYIPSKYQEDWKLNDPSGGSIEDFRIIRDIIKKKMIYFINIIKNNDK